MRGVETNIIMPLGRSWDHQLARLIRGAKKELVISSPFITTAGTDFVVSHISKMLRDRGTMRILTDLSPDHVCQGSIDPAALQSLIGRTKSLLIHHLPRLHSKVYVSDENCSIVTSGNLTSGGLRTNYEYGVEIVHGPTVRAIRDDIVSYSVVGVAITPDRLCAYCELVAPLRDAFRKAQASTQKALRDNYNSAFRTAGDELIRLKLAGGAMHTVFEKTIVYVLQTHGPLRTKELHPRIEAIHPELCDNTIDRVIDGQNFGKKWKHAVRTAQQQLKHKGQIELSRNRWSLTGLGLKVRRTKW
jgi:hypothetical protein